MPGAIHGKSMPWFTINEHLSMPAIANKPIDTTHITAVCFNVDVHITIGAMSESFELPKGTPMGIDTSTDTIKVGADCFIFCMGGR